MSQNLNLSIAGIFTSINDFQGLPPGALDGADNIEIRFKNLAEPRRGFEGLDDSYMVNVYFKRLTNFYVAGVDRVIGLTSDDDLVYYTGANPWPAVPGVVSTNIVAPNSVDGKCRFISAGQNLYITAQDGIRSLSTGTAASMVRAGVPKGLNLQAATNDDQTGFMTNNQSVLTTGKVTNASPTLTNFADSTGIVVGQYVSADDVYATLVVQDLTYTSVVFGAAGNSTTIAYVGGGALSVAVVGTAITVTLETGVSTATLVKAAVDAYPTAAALVTVAITGTGSNVQVAAGATALAGGLDSIIPIGTKVQSITAEAPLIIQTGDTTAGSASIANVASITGIVADVLVTGTGIPEGAKVVSTSGAGPYAVVLDVASYFTATGTNLTFSSSLTVTLDANAVASDASANIQFYEGSQCGYRMVFGRVETDLNGSTVTRIGTPSSLAIATNLSPWDTNVEIVGTIPKNASDSLSFVQLYRTTVTDTSLISPLDQYALVYERNLVSGDFVTRTITITDEVEPSLVGIPLYTGSDQEGIGQANDPPPMAWDMCKFRDFTLFGNITRPSSLQFTLLAVGSPSGLQSGDTITIVTDFNNIPDATEVYTAAGSEVAASRQFKVYSAGTPSQNITDTAESFIRVLNYDEDMPVHAIYLSSATDTPGQILLEADYPDLGTFNVTASAHTAAYDPELDDLDSDINSIPNGVAVSKTSELEAVPLLNFLPAGDSSSSLLRMIALRDYVIVIKTDGVYKINGYSPNGLLCTAFDLTTKIIGADTAVSLNSSVFMLSTQGVVSISDGGTNAMSIPVDDQLNELVGSYLDNIRENAFALGYESDRKYILSLPDSGGVSTNIQYNYNYVTQAWTTWSRSLYSGFIHSNDNKIYIARANEEDTGVSKERKNYSYTDFVDEAFDVVVTAVDDNVLTLTNAIGIEVGDVFYQSSSLFSPITAVDLDTNEITLLYTLSFTTGTRSVLTAYLCVLTWKQVFASNPAMTRQFGEGVALFKNTRFNTATMRFVTDFSQGVSDVPITGVGNSLWGLFPWGEEPWGTSVIPQKIRFLVPQDKQFGSYLIPELRVKQGYSNFRIQGLAIEYVDCTFEVGN